MSQYAPPPGLPPAAATQYAPPPGAPPPTVQFAPPPGTPPPATQYAPPAEVPPSNSASDPFTDDAAPTDAPPPYSKRVPDGSAPAPVPDQSSVRFITLPAPPASAIADDAHRPLDPPPSCFSTPTPLRVRSKSFEPFVIPSAGPSLNSGFAPLYAPDLLGPHGVSQEDWAEFLRGVGAAARLATRGVSAVAPYRGSAPARVIGLLTGPRGAAGGPYDRAFVRSPVEEVMALVDVWNGSAFERRKVRVSLHARAERGGGQREGYELLVEAL